MFLRIFCQSQNVWVKGIWQERGKEKLLSSSGWYHWMEFLIHTLSWHSFLPACLIWPDEFLRSSRVGVISDLSFGVSTMTRRTQDLNRFSIYTSMSGLERNNRWEPRNWNKIKITFFLSEMGTCIFSFLSAQASSGGHRQSRTTACRMERKCRHSCLLSDE